MMNTKAVQLLGVLGLCVSAFGCGAIPDVILTAGRDSVRETVEGFVDEAVDGFADDLLDSELLPFPIEDPAGDGLE